MRKQGWIVAAAVVAGMAVAGWARAQEWPGEPEEPPTVEELLGALIEETKGVRGHLAARSSGSSDDLASVVREIRDALRPKEVVVVRLPAWDASPSEHEAVLAPYTSRGY